MKILGIDYGDVRTGIAVSDESEFLASPVTVIKETYAPKLVEKIIVLIEEKKAKKIVLGIPKNMDGTEGFRAEKCRELGKMLEEKTQLEVKYIDERLTTVSAHKLMNFTDTKGKKRKETVDAVSAVFILQSYLDMKQ